MASTKQQNYNKNMFQYIECLASHAPYGPSVCRLSSVTFVRPTQAVQIFGNISTALGTLAIH